MARRLKSSADFRNAIGVLRAGATIELKVVRNGKQEVFTAMSEAPKQERFEGRLISRRLDGATFGSIAEDSPLLVKWMVYKCWVLTPAARPGALACVSMM